MRRTSDNIHQTLVILAQPDGPADPGRVLTPLDGTQRDRYLELVEHHRLTLSLVDAARCAGYELTGPTGERLRHLEADDRATRLRVLRARRAAAEALIGLDWVTLKGETIAAAMPRPHLRTFNDLDLLVGPTQMADAATALIDAGFEELNQNWSAYLDHVVGEVPFGGHGATVDLHWQLVALKRARRTIRFDINALLERRRYISSHDDSIPALSAEDQLLHTATHCALGGATRLDQLRDLAVLAGGHERSLDWEVINARARTWGVRHLVGHALDRSALTLGYRLPEPARTLTSGPHISTRRVVDRLAGARHTTVATARDSRSGAVRALGEVAVDHAYSRMTGATRWDFTAPSSRLYHGNDGHQNANDADQGRHRYYELVAEQA